MSCCCSLPTECCAMCSNRLPHDGYNVWAEPMWKNHFWPGTLSEEDIDTILKSIEKIVNKSAIEVKQCEQS